jgi:hypothetical protein
MAHVPTNPADGQTETNDPPVVPQSDLLAASAIGDMPE